MFCNNCGKEVSDKAVICKECGVPVKGQSNSWHFKNALIGLSLFFLYMIFIGGLSAALMRPSAAQFDQNLSHILSIIMGLSMFGAIYFIFYFVSKRAEKKTLKITS